MYVKEIGQGAYMDSFDGLGTGKKPCTMKGRGNSRPSERVRCKKKKEMG